MRGVSLLFFSVLEACFVFVFVFGRGGGGRCLGALATQVCEAHFFFFDSQCSLPPTLFGRAGEEELPFGGKVRVPIPATSEYPLGGRGKIVS
jgi:hypothetical protein